MFSLPCSQMTKVQLAGNNDLTNSVEYHSRGPKLCSNSVVSQHFMEPRRFITPFTRALHLYLSWARSIQSIPPKPISKRTYAASLRLPFRFLMILWGLQFVRFEVFTAVTMKNVIFWDATPCGSCKNRRFGATWRDIPEDGILHNLYLFIRNQVLTR
jgi:hypothetical protein